MSSRYLRRVKAVGPGAKFCRGGLRQKDETRGTNFRKTLGFESLDASGTASFGTKSQVCVERTKRVEGSKLNAESGEFFKLSKSLCVKLRSRDYCVGSLEKRAFFLATPVFLAIEIKGPWLLRAIAT